MEALWEGVRSKSAPHDNFERTSLNKQAWRETSFFFTNLLPWILHRSAYLSENIHYSDNTLNPSLELYIITHIFCTDRSLLHEAVSTYSSTVIHSRIVCISTPRQTSHLSSNASEYVLNHCTLSKVDNTDECASIIWRPKTHTSFLPHSCPFSPETVT
jgi:hypothetical protein